VCCLLLVFVVGGVWFVAVAGSVSLALNRALDKATLAR
jgi:hypothetical protein